MHTGAFHGLANIADFTYGVSTDPKSMMVVSCGMRMCPNRACNTLVFITYSGDKILESFPPERIDFDATNLPADILASLEEAIACHAAGAYRATALMVRRVLEELCQAKGTIGNDLKSRIKSLGSSAILPADLLGAMDELRILGNDAAHLEARTYDNVGRDEASLAIELAKELLKAVYQYSKLLDKLRSLKGSA
ncbi:MAG TPA: DUF4145 domain-containing protein [Caulobacteraceae bacterium]|jgi:hypothetical protein|nr:DUF4145 domain-containing protein [Caulobacteraceae bacterium]